MNWNINYGDCELQTYTLSDADKQAFTLKLSCVQGLILLQFQSAEQRQSASELSKATGIPGKEITQCMNTFVARSLLLEESVDGTAKYSINPEYNSGKPESGSAK